MLTPSLPLSRSLDLPVCLARFPSARLWLKDETLEDSANLPDPDIIAAEIDSRIAPFAYPSGFPVYVVRSRDLHCRRPPRGARPVRRRNAGEGAAGLSNRRPFEKVRL